MTRNSQKKITTIAVSSSTKRLLFDMKKYDETYDELIQRLIRRRKKR